MSAAAAQVRQLAETLARDAGVEVLDVQLKGPGVPRHVRIVVDRKGGVDLGVCQSLSQQLSARLDDTDPIAGRYVLEVTSPGIDYPLQGRAAFNRVEGRDVLVHRSAADGHVRQVRGRVDTADDDGVVLAVGGDARERIPYGEIVKATQTLPW